MTKIAAITFSTPHYLFDDILIGDIHIDDQTRQGGLVVNETAKFNANTTTIERKTRILNELAKHPNLEHVVLDWGTSYIIKDFLAPGIAKLSTIMWTGSNIFYRCENERSSVAPPITLIKASRPMADNQMSHFNRPHASFCVMNPNLSNCNMEKLLAQDDHMGTRLMMIYIAYRALVKGDPSPVKDSSSAVKLTRDFSVERPVVSLSPAANVITISGPNNSFTISLEEENGRIVATGDLDKLDEGAQVFFKALAKLNNSALQAAFAAGVRACNPDIGDRDLEFSYKDKFTAFMTKTATL